MKNKNWISKIELASQILTFGIMVYVFIMGFAYQNYWGSFFMFVPIITINYVFQIRRNIHFLLYNKDLTATAKILSILSLLIFGLPFIPIYKVLGIKDNSLIYFFFSGCILLSHLLFVIVLTLKLNNLTEVNSN